MEPAARPFKCCIFNNFREICVYFKCIFMNQGRSERSIIITLRALDTGCVASRQRHGFDTAPYSNKTIGSTHLYFALSRWYHYSNPTWPIVQLLCSRYMLWFDHRLDLEIRGRVVKQYLKVEFVGGGLAQ